MTTKIPLISRLSARIIRVLGCNPGPMTLQGTNTYIIGTGRKRVLLDAGDSGITEYTSALADVLRKEKCTLEGIFITHWHQDHIGGVSDVLGVINSIGTSDCSIWKLARTDEEYEEYDGFIVKFIENGSVISTEGATIRVIGTPGHTTDHAAVWLDEESAVFSGDCVLGEGTTVFEHLSSYMSSLQKLADLKPKILFPGHGPVVENANEKIKQYINHRLERERNILSALSELSKVKPLGITEMDIVNIVYQGLGDHLKLAAASNVRHHLVKLLEEDKVSESSGHLWYLKEVTTKL